MQVPSLGFLLFAAAGALVFNLSSAPAWRRAVLLGCNLAFLASFAPTPAALIPYAAFLGLGFAGVFWLQRGAPPKAGAGLICLILAVFFWLKRYSFVPSASFLDFPYLTIGLSYAFFRVLHLVIEARSGALVARVSVADYLNYTLNFTALVSGPIQRFEDYQSCQTTPPKIDAAAVGTAIERIAIGFAKVVVVSSILIALQHQAIDRFDSDPDALARVLDATLLCTIYPVYLYANFSGYCDVVIGVARFFRLVLPENFDYPFAAASFIEYWSRWHITLSEWLKAHVYTPFLMVLMRRIRSPSLSPYLGVLAFFVTFFLIGAWHGQTTEFLFFGLLNGLGVAANKFYQIVIARRLGRKAYAALGRKPWYRAGARGLTYAWVSFSLLWFWSNWRQLAFLYTRLGTAGVLTVSALTILASSLLLSLVETARPRGQYRSGAFWRSRYTRTVLTTALVVVMIGFTVTAAMPAPDIIYKAF